LAGCLPSTYAYRHISLHSEYQVSLNVRVALGILCTHAGVQPLDMCAWYNKNKQLAFEQRQQQQPQLNAKGNHCCSCWLICSN